MRQEEEVRADSSGQKLGDRSHSSHVIPWPQNTPRQPRALCTAALTCGAGPCWGVRPPTDPGRLPRCCH